MRIPLGLFSLLALLHVTDAAYSGKFCPSACDFTLSYATFNDTDSWLAKKVQSCRSDLRVTSLYLCFAQYCKDVSILQWIREQSSWCSEHAGVALPDFHDIVDNWSQEEREAIRRLDATKAKSFPVLGQITIPDAQFIDRAYATMDVAFRQYDLHLLYGWYMYYFWIAVVTVGVSTRLLSLVGSLQERKRHEIDSGYHSGPKRPRRKFLPSLSGVWLKRYLITPATFGNHCSQPYGWCTIPPRVQSITILVFVILNITLCICSYELTEGNLYWPEKSAQLLRFVSDRTGIISLANFPLVWLFGMRNDVLMWITGWGFGTYNAFHRWVARLATVQAVIHSLGYTIMILESGGWSHFLKYWRKHYFWNGELATIAMCALLAFSLYGIRRAHYEIFLVTHIVLSIVTLWTMYYHVEIFTKGEWNIFIWPCLVIWVLDRVLRAGRIITFNRSFWNTKATASYDPASNLVRMDVDGNKNWMQPEPGSYYYIHVLDDIMFAHQNHPFTLAYISTNTAKSSSTPLSPACRPAFYRTASEESTESDALLASSKNSRPSNLVFLIRPYDGFTSRLKSHCLLHPKQLRVLVEGPYGHSEPLHHFPAVLFIVGGTGVAVPLSHMSRLLSASSRTQSVKIVWAVREHAFLASILRDFASLLEDERIDVEVHVTHKEEVADQVLGEDLKSVRIVAQRPDVRRKVREAADDTGRNGDLAIVACGPAGMADEARSASVDMLAEGYGGVEYFEESFKW
ncbi:ferric-chelate reductase-like protein [Ampelomyces quisqualis]|uniref:Ferric-chelate reductase-like protein n=1 Tax=Ampelomyces quisqualis TaxID=50730 RepID=A0A6A5QP82_AMPQU|nr:ferric-chelate reductase-like protein [Ampelomyces quisqualis]